MSRSRLEAFVTFLQFVDLLRNLILDPFSWTPSRLLNIDFVLSGANSVFFLSGENLLCVLLSDQLTAQVLFITEHIVV